MVKQPNDVVITGVGIVTCHGTGKDAHLALLSAKTAPEAVLETEKFAPYVVHKLPEIDWSEQIGRKDQRQMENWQGKPDARYRGTGGPVWCQAAKDPHPVAPAMLAACKSLGLPILEDLNGAREEGLGGFALMNQIIKEGRRQSIARAYLYQALARKNVTLLVNAHVDRLTFQGTTATGVELRRGGVVSKVGASTEVIVCAGGINTPKLMMLSGIGDPKQLKAHGIKTLVNSPDVGQHFQDHLLHGGCMTVTGRTMAENLADVVLPEGQDVVVPASRPINPTGATNPQSQITNPKSKCLYLSKTAE